MGLVIPAGAILKKTLDANLEPSGRQVDVGAQLVIQTHAGKASIQAVASNEPGHDKDAEFSFSLLATTAWIFDRVLCSPSIGISNLPCL